MNPQSENPLNKLAISALAIALLAVASVAFLPALTAKPTGKWFDHIVTIAMENQDYSSVIGNSAAPFINGLAAAGTVFPAYHSYGAGNFGGDTIGGCSAGCYVALVSGSDDGVSDGYSCCLPGPTIVDQLQSAGLTWEALCAQGCPRGE